jgi:hypothetical protein
MTDHLTRYRILQRGIVKWQFILEKYINKATKYIVISCAIFDITVKTPQQLVFCSCFYSRPVLQSPVFAVNLATIITRTKVVQYKH